MNGRLMLGYLPLEIYLEGLTVSSTKVDWCCDIEIV
jgi:hypothetical protein